MNEFGLPAKGRVRVTMHWRWFVWMIHFCFFLLLFLFSSLIFCLFAYFLSLRFLFLRFLFRLLLFLSRSLLFLCDYFPFAPSDSLFLFRKLIPINGGV